MAGGLWMLLDDMTVFAKIAAKAAAKSGSKAAGIVVDDAAVTPSYVHNLAATRELPIIARIAALSMRNKVLVLLPLCLLLGMLDPRFVSALLLAGALYLAYEAATKMTGGHHHGPDATTEDVLVRQAGRTDLVLSAEIMVIALNEVLDQGLALQAVALLLVAVGMTVAVYGTVALLVKGDDIGVAVSRSRRRPIAALGRGIVRATVGIMRLLSIVGVAAMCWVSGHIMLEQAARFSVTWPYDAVHAAAHGVHGVPVLPWIVETALYSTVGVAVGFAATAIIRYGSTMAGRLSRRGSQG
jgi:predicted DNA repair protein MutK